MRNLLVVISLLTPGMALADTLTFPASLHYGCLPNTATLTLSAPAPSGGSTFLLSSSQPSLLQPPASATVPEGQTTTTIPVTTSYVDTNTIVTLTATGPTTLNRNLTLRPNGPVAITAASSIGPGQSANGTFTLVCVAPAGGHVVNMSSSSALLTVPATVDVLAGSTQGSFTMVAGDFTTTSTATVTASRGGVSRSRTVTLKLPTVATLRFNSSIPIGSLPTTGTVTLDVPAGTSGVVVDLASLNPSVAWPDVPQVTVAGGQLDASFAVSTATVNEQTVVTFTATANGATTQGTLTVRPNRMENFRASHLSLSVCRAINGEAQLLVPAGSAGATVGLSVDRSDIVTLTPTTLDFAMGEETLPFTATTSAAPATPQAATITGTFNITKLLHLNVVRTSAVGCP